MGKWNILVTGANGFIGHHLCRKLLENEHSVLAITRSRSPLQLEHLLKRPGMHVEVGDITNETFVRELFASNKIDVVFHMAIESSQSNTPDSSFKSFSPQTQAYQTNVLGTFNLLQHASRGGVSAWIQSSSMSVYDYENPQHLPVDESHPVKPINIYGLTKLLSDEICQYYNANTPLRCLILRYSGVFGTGKTRGIIARLIKNYLHSESESIDVNTNRTSDFVYVEDVVSANLLAMEKLVEDKYDTRQNQFIFNIGCGEETSVKELADLMIKVTGSKLNINPITASRPRRFYFDIGAARKILNYHPREIHQALAEYIEREKIAGGEIER
jgi:UDP-glucose 4-epimerase